MDHYVKPCGETILDTVVRRCASLPWEELASQDGFVCSITDDSDRRIRYEITYERRCTCGGCGCACQKTTAYIFRVSGEGLVDVCVQRAAQYPKDLYHRVRRLLCRRSAKPYTDPVETYKTGCPHGQG